MPDDLEEPGVDPNPAPEENEPNQRPVPDGFPCDFEIPKPWVELIKKKDGELIEKLLESKTRLEFRQSLWLEDRAIYDRLEKCRAHKLFLNPAERQGFNNPGSNRIVLMAARVAWQAHDLIYCNPATEWRKRSHKRGEREEASARAAGHFENVSSGTPITVQSYPAIDAALTAHAFGTPYWLWTEVRDKDHFEIYASNESARRAELLTDDGWGTSKQKEMRRKKGKKLLLEFDAFDAIAELAEPSAHFEIVDDPAEARKRGFRAFGPGHRGYGAAGAVTSDKIIKAGKPLWFRHPLEPEDQNFKCMLFARHPDGEVTLISIAVYQKGQINWTGAFETPVVPGAEFAFAAGDYDLFLVVANSNVTLEETDCVKRTGLADAGESLREFALVRPEELLDLRRLLLKSEAGAWRVLQGTMKVK